MRLAFLLVLAACATGHVGHDTDSELHDTPVDAAPCDHADAGDGSSDGPDASVIEPADPFTLDAACTPMTFAALVPRFAPGATVATIAQPFTLVTRHRESCNEVTGCTPWIAGGVLLYAAAGYGTPAIEPFPPPSSGSVELRLIVTPGWPSFMRLDLRAEGPSGEPIHLDCTGPHQGNSAGDITECWMQSAPNRVYLVEVPQVAPVVDVLWDGRICDDGRFHFVTRLASYPSPVNLAQLAIYGQL